MNGRVAVKNGLKRSLRAVGLLEPLQTFRQERAERGSRNQGPMGLSLFSRFVSRGDLCIDVGANVGDVTQMFLELGARVIAVEPQRENIAILQRRFHNNAAVTIVPKGLAASPGEQELLVCSSGDCSSMDPEFVARVSASGRLPASEYRWDSRQTVEVTTLDLLIRQFGQPAFVKVDVEGFEYEVIRSLVAPVRALSIEFTPERFPPTFRCIEHLASLGDVEFNYTIGRSMKFDTARAC
jgi:FkbM family methyltransferase